METINVELPVAKETYELCQGLDAVVGAVQTALADGWQAGADLPVVITATIANLIPAMQGMEQIPAEAKQTQEFVNALYAGLSPIVGRFTK